MPIPQRKPSNTNGWRDHATADERLWLDAAEVRADALDRERRAITAELNVVRNRICQRAKSRGFTPLANPAPGAPSTLAGRVLGEGGA